MFGTHSHICISSTCATVIVTITGYFQTSGYHPLTQKFLPHFISHKHGKRRCDAVMKKFIFESGVKNAISTQHAVAYEVQENIDYLPHRPKCIRHYYRQSIKKYLQSHLLANQHGGDQ